MIFFCSLLQTGSKCALTSALEFSFFNVLYLVQIFVLSIQALAFAQGLGMETVKYQVISASKAEERMQTIRKGGLI